MVCCGKSDGVNNSRSGSRSDVAQRQIRQVNEQDEQAPCCCCCCCFKGGCSKRAATLAFGAIGLILAVGVIVPPVYLYSAQGGQEADYAILFPVLKYGRKYLRQITDDQSQKEYATISPSSSGNNNSIASTNNAPNDNTVETITPRQTYRLAIFQLLDDTENMAHYFAFFSFVMGCINVPLNLLLIVGACWRKSCLIMPWIVITLLEHLIVGIPIIVFIGLISLYLAAQLQLYILATVLMVLILTLFLLSLSSWFTVYSCYTLFNDELYQYQMGDTTNGGGGSYDYTDCQSTQPLMNAAADQPPPPLPNGHPHFNNQHGGGGYSVQGHPHISYSSQYPSAPPPTGIYPSLNA